jgi:hypothetical protein
MPLGRTQHRNFFSSILVNHWHPVETASAPDMLSRRAAITFTVIADTNNMVLGPVTYTFLNTLGSPAANNVHVKIQGTLQDTVKKLAQAIRGETDATNIVYGTGTQPNPICTGYWTSQRFSTGLTTIPAGQSLFLLERAEDVITAITLTSTATSTIVAFLRTPFSRYILNGNAAGTGGINSIRSAMHTILPIGSVLIGGQTAPMGLVAYDVHSIIMEDQSTTDKKEIDIYMSSDEVTFTRVSRSNPMAFNGTAASIQVVIESRGQRIPKGYGMYVRCGSDGTSPTANFDLKFSYHLYPTSLS